MTFVRKSSASPVGLLMVDGFMMPNGEFRQAIERAQPKAVGSKTFNFGYRQLIGGGGSFPCIAHDLPAFTGSKTADIINDGGRGINLSFAGRPERLLSLSLAQSVWSHEARHGSSKSQDQAWEILDAF